MGKGSNSSSTNSSSSSYTRPDENAYQSYLALMNRASGVAATPYQGYGGEETAPINDQQRAGISGVNQSANFLQGQNQPLSAADIQRYQDPYTNEVIDATQKDFDVQNARQQSQVTGNAAAQGALGGDRSAVAAALAAEGQTRVQSPIIAGLRSQGYQSAVKTAEDQQQQMLRAGVAGLQGAQSQFGVGTLEQQTQQAKDTQGRMDYYQQQGYPFQVAQWLAQMETGVGSQMGGTGTNTGTSTTQGPTPNPWAQVAGVGLAAAGMFAADGGRVGGVHQFADGGGLRLSPDEMEAFHAWRSKHGYAGGGSPYGAEQTWVPTVSGIAAGRGAPGAPSLPSAPSAPQQKGLSGDQMKGIGAVGKKIGGLDWSGMRGAMDSGDPMSGDAWGGGSYAAGDAWGGSAINPASGLSADDYSLDYRSGGRIRGYEDGGDVSFDDRFDAAYPRTSGFGGARPAFGGVVPMPRPRPEAADDPDEPVYRMQGNPAEYRAAMRSIDEDRGAGTTAQNEPGAPKGVLPPEIQTGQSKAPVMASEDAGEPSSAMGYSGAPRFRTRPQPGVAASGYQPSPFDDAQWPQGPVGAPGQQGAPTPAMPDEGFLSRMGIRVTPEMKQGLLQAGLAMMATRHGGPGSFLSSLGEAGMTGVGAYNATQQNALEQANKEHKEQFEREKFERPYSEMTAAQKAADRRAKEAADREKIPSGYRTGKDGSLEYIKGGPEDPDRIKEKETAKRSSVEGLSDTGVEVAARQAAMGDQSWAKNIGRGAQSAKDVTKVRNRLSDILINEMGKSPQEAAKFVAEASRSWAASQIAENAGARTRANRVANLDMILEVADSAVPAVLEMSAKLPRGPWTPINKIVQKGQVMASNPELAEFGVANLQLAEGWARAMNPTGVMRESDRDKALEFLSTATSPETYERVVKQIQKQIHREKEAISRGHSPKEITTTAGDMPSPRAIEMLNSDPRKYREDFEKRYGKGSVDRFLGK